MPTLREYFTDDQIFSHLCEERLKVAGSRNDRQYICRLVGNIPEAEPESLLHQMLPRRRQWNAFRPRYRRSGSSPDLLGLNNAVRALHGQTARQPWVAELNRFIADIQERVFGANPFSFTAPNITWKRKKEKRHEYRALCRFNLQDNLILCLYARYLRDAFDPGFSSSSYAFRSRDGRGHMPTHHQAFESIFELKKAKPHDDLYVAEADIMGFYDSVDHVVALTAFRQAAQRVNLHPRSEVIFCAYLDCYSFPQNVLAEAGTRLRQRAPQGHFKWPEDALREIHHANPHMLRIGVPQGGAISGVVANLILDAADKSVEEERARLGANVHYFRFCDDMVLLSPSKKQCKSLFQVYLKMLHNLRLPYHEPKKTHIYGKSHWDHKSKAPYCWSGRKWFGCVPWMQFVGYQIRYDGLVRPRKESVRKQADKLMTTREMLKSRLVEMSVENPLLATKMQALTSLKCKLVAQGVGRVKAQVSTGPLPMCWASGFKALHNKPFVSGALRLLDRVRRKQIGRFAHARIRYGRGRNGRGGHRRNPIGYAFSYHGQFTNLGGPDLIQNPWRPRNLKDMLKQFTFLLLTGELPKRWYRNIRIKIAKAVRNRYRAVR